MWLWIVLGLLAALALAFLVMWAIGRRLPEEHVVTASLRLSKGCDEVWRVLSDVAAQPTWDAGVTKVERLPDRDGRETVRMTAGRNSFVLQTTRSDPPHALERTIADDAKFFSGRWEYALSPDGAGCRVTLTERGRIFHAVPRFLVRKVMDPATYLKKHLRSLAAKFGEPPVLRE
jgi:hypothetical protein